MKKAKTNDQHAKNITKLLMQSGSGYQADRLVLMREQAGKPPMDLGGWCRGAIAAQIADYLNEHFPAPKKARRA